ncbi:hypothetical protein IHE55_00220 [Streptomyces pactum]|uniref:Uncharacterized protein n=1 Tax=Streptomyces pactum TaxID=68249 RepID=A0ABS0NDT0_9ACTN|nr:hypothetical protein [Streptomyces pactum]MBH5333311.1 hypothetical protein [Streptomyces pactum]
MATARLAPGVTLVTVPGRGLAVRTPDGTFLRVNTGQVDAGALVGHLTTGGPAADPRLAALTEAFAAAGHLARRTPAPLDGRTVFLLGDTALTGPLARYARDAGATVHHRAALPGVAPADAARTAVVWCLDRPAPPAAWQEADRLPARGTAWLRCHREGHHVWLEPLACAAGDVTSAHVRLRRLAATPAHRELAAYWDGHRTPDTGPAHTEASAAYTAALLTGDLLAWAGGAPRPVRRRLRRLDLRDLRVTEHPVLPVPEVAPLPAGGAR